MRTCAGERGGITLDCSRLGFGPPVKHKSGKEPSQESRVIVSRDCFRVPYTHVSSRGAGPLCPLSSGSFTLFVVVRGAGPLCPLTGFGPVYHQTTSPSPASSREEKTPRRGRERITVRSVLSPPARRSRTRTHARRDREGRPREGERERAQTERERAARSPALRS